MFTCHGVTKHPQCWVKALITIAYKRRQNIYHLICGIVLPPHKLFPQSTALHAFSVGVELIIEHVHLSLTHASKEIDVTFLLHKFYVLRSSKIICSHICWVGSDDRIRSEIISSSIAIPVKLCRGMLFFLLTISRQPSPTVNEFNIDWGLILGSNDSHHRKKYINNVFLFVKKKWELSLNRNIW